MKRKGDHSSCDKENERPSKSVEKNRNNQNNCLQSQSSSTRQRLAEEDVRSSVEMTSVFKRLFGALEKHQINTKNASVRDHLRSTPNTPRNICRKTFGDSSKRHVITLFKPNFLLDSLLVFSTQYCCCFPSIQTKLIRLQTREVVLCH